MLSGEATNNNFIAFGLEPTIYRTQGEHANLYETDAVERGVKDKKYLFYDPPPQNHCHPRYHLDQNQPELDVFQQV